MNIRKAENADMDKILHLYAGARTFMARHGNPSQWGTTYPPAALVEEDIRTGCCYLCEEQGQLAAVFFYCNGEDKTYRCIFEGSWLNDAPYGVVHRIASSGIVRGAASFCLDWAVKQCKNLKIDTHRENTVMQRLLLKNGFSYCGIIYLEDGEERLAYQKCLPEV